MSGDQTSLEFASLTDGSRSRVAPSCAQTQHAGRNIVCRDGTSCPFSSNHGLCHQVLYVSRHFTEAAWRTAVAATSRPSLLSLRSARDEGGRRAAQLPTLCSLLMPLLWVPFGLKLTPLLYR
eukprot:658223-Amphidinium_carterae.1